MSRILKSYLKRLTNLSSRNKSLLLPRLISEQFADLHAADFLLNLSSFEVLQQVIQRRARIPLCDVSDPRYDKVNQLSRTLRKIARTETFIAEERGSRDLYIGYPFVRGKFADDTVVHAPLLFFPVTLRMDREQWCLSCRNDVGVVLNRTFALAYSRFNEARVPDSVLETAFEEFPTNATLFRTELYKWLKESAFNINFNQDLFEDRLQPFQSLKTSDLEVLEKTGELKLYPEAVLGIFPQSGSYLEPDYQFLISNLGDELALKAFRPSEVTDAPVKEEQLLTPFPMDLSQEKAICAVKQGASIVIQGPPGTGKSQLICNLMADFAARGKRVLLVCQKRAALDVVYERLRQAGLGEFAALIHDYKSDRSSLYEQMARQIDRAQDYRNENYSLDAVFLEREFYRESRQIDRIVDELAEFRNALYDDQDAGISIKELYLTSKAGEQALPLTDVLRHFPMEKAESFRPRLKNYMDYWLRITPDHAWHRRRDFSGLHLADFHRIQQVLSEWPAFYEQQQAGFREITGQPFEKTYLRDLASLKKNIRETLRILEDPTVFELFKNYKNRPETTQARLAFTERVIRTLKSKEGMETSLASGQLESFRNRLAKARQAKESILGGQWWEWFSADRHEIRAVCHRNNLTTDPEDLKLLDRLVQNRLELEAWLRNEFLHFDPNLMSRSGDFITRHLTFFGQSDGASAAVKLLQLKPWSKILLQLAADHSNKNHFFQKLKQLLQWVEAWQLRNHDLEQWLLPDQYALLLSAPSSESARLAADLEAHFDDLVEMDALWKTFSREEQVVAERLGSLGTAMALRSAEAYTALFDNSIRLAWIAHIETRYPSLRSVSSLKMQQWEEELQNAIVRKQNLSGDIIRMMLRERVYYDIEKNRLGNPVTYRDLNHQVTKKRRIWPIRKLLERNTEEVFRLLPLWMTSPEAASAIFPMEEGLFDLVIFDEASQCYAEYALPAAFRGRQLVVAGDSKQLSPTDLYKIRYEENFEDDDEILPPALEAESLLDLASQHLHDYSLKGHYRSLSLDLIQFSNTHFYKNSLQLLPDYTRVNDAEPGISFHKVNGIWEQGVNTVEAQKVVELVRTFREDTKSVGIVTFNYPQQHLIQELLEQAGVTAPELFVKNIENVQGDERDVIIFSIGYALDTQGRLMMQFGSLNSRGGENRLNVAITRAKAKIHIVTSLWPSQLRTENSTFEGPRLLKAYLQYAHDVSEGNFTPQPVPVENFKRKWLLKDQLVSKIPDARLELPFADITLKGKDGYKGLILTDDDLYFRSASPKEPHAYLPIALAGKQWPFKRIFSRAYWSGKEPVI